MTIPAWQNLGTQESVDFTCGYCGRDVGGDRGYGVGGEPWRIYICPRCGKPSFYDLSTHEQVPGPQYGNEVEHLPTGVKDLYKEARDCVAAGANTAAVLTCRKILMHIAVAQSASEGKSFMEYVEYLADKGYIPPHGKGWVDHIRKRGNEANHEIEIMQPDDAKDLVTFVEALLKFIYELPRRVPAEPAAEAP